jgi:hypothetical protein
VDVTAATAGQHLNRLVNANILSEITGRKRDRQFVAPELLAALDTDDEPDDTGGEATGVRRH